MWELDYKESWTQKNWCFWTVVLEKTLESPLDSKEIQPVHPKGNQSWIFIGGTDAKAETPILWPPDVENWLIGKDPDAGKDWRQEKKMTVHFLQCGRPGFDPCVGKIPWRRAWQSLKYACLENPHGQKSLAGYSPLGSKESDMAEVRAWAHVLCTCVGKYVF